MGGGGSRGVVVGGEQAENQQASPRPSPLSVSTLAEDLLSSSVPVTPDVSRTSPTTPKGEEQPLQIRMSAATPKGDAQLALTPFYCPICMLWLSEMLVTTCCAHNICEPCLVAWRVAGDNNENGMTCPHCASASFHVTPLEDGALSRSYHSEGNNAISGQQHFTNTSPLKIGASFDELRRKLRPFQVGTQQGAVVTRYVTQVLEKAIQSFIAKTQ